MQLSSTVNRKHVAVEVSTLLFSSSQYSLCLASLVQLSFTDNREHAAVDLGVLAASGAAILTLTCMSEAAPTALELRLPGSLRQLLRTMEAAGERH